MIDFYPHAKRYLDCIFRSEEPHNFNFQLEKLTKNYNAGDKILIFDGNKIDSNFEQFLNKNFLYSNLSFLKIYSAEIIREPITETIITAFHKIDKNNYAEVIITYHNNCIYSAELKFEDKDLKYIVNFLLNL